MRISCDTARLKLIRFVSSAPHSAFYSPESLAEIRSKSAETMRDILIHGIMSNVVNRADVH